MHTIKSMREHLKITQSELAKMLGVTQGAVSQWENGTTRPDIKLLPKLAQILKCTVDELLGIEKP